MITKKNATVHECAMRITHNGCRFFFFSPFMARYNNKKIKNKQTKKKKKKKKKKKRCNLNNILKKKSI